ncbi:MAG: radical SAM protein [Candidatus Helarchaeota archaeon]|nr:radical SAM protein [Candidatus Helarchaeota archaeon]
MRVLLVMPDYPKTYRYGPHTDITFPPLGLECIAAQVQDIAETKIIDNRLINLTRIKEEIEQFQPNYVGLSCTYSIQIYHVNSIAKIAKENGATTVVGGWHPSLLPHETLAFPWIDMVVRSEGDLTFRELIQKNGPIGVKGLSYRNNGSVIHNPDRELADLNQFPLPARNLRSQEANSRYKFFGLATDCIETSKGCPFKCTFCAIHNFYRHKYRYRSISHIMKELRQIRKKRRYIYIIDDNFVVNPKHVKGLCDAIIRERLNMFFMTNARVDMVTKRPDVFKRMAKAGFIFLLLGLESFSDKSLQNLNKQFRFQEIKDAIKILHNLGFIIQGNIILGANFDDTEQDLESTIEIAKFLDLDMPTFSLLTPYPKTELMEEVQEKDLLLTKDWRKFNWFTPTMKYQHLTSDQLQKYLDKAYAEVPFFKNPIPRFGRMLKTRGLPFFLSRVCNFPTLKATFSGFKKLVTHNSKTN